MHKFCACFQVLSSYQYLPPVPCSQLQCQCHHLRMEGQQVQRNPAPNLPPELDAEAEDHADDEHQQQDRGSDKDYRGDRGGSSLSFKHIEL